MSSRATILQSDDSYDITAMTIVRHNSGTIATIKQRYDCTIYYRDDSYDVPLVARAAFVLTSETHELQTAAEVINNARTARQGGEGVVRV